MQVLNVTRKTFRKASQIDLTVQHRPGWLSSMEPRKPEGISSFDINEAYRILAASVEAAPRELASPEATALSPPDIVHSKDQGAFSSSPSVVMATVLPARGISSVGKTPSLTSKMVMVRPAGELGHWLWAWLGRDCMCG